MNNMIAIGDVDAILDCDGFELSGLDIQKTSVSTHIARIPAKRKAVFLCREMAIAILKYHEPFLTRNAFFETPTIDLTPQHRGMINFCSRLHGLPWRSQNSERIVHPQKQVEAVIRQWYDIVRQTSRKNRPVVAYKGGHYELDLLTTMNIPTCNIEQWDCPKVDVVQAQFLQVDPSVHMCYKGNHALASDSELIYCPKLVVTLFAEFMANKWKENRRERKRKLNKKALERRILRRWIWGDCKRR